MKKITVINNSNIPTGHLWQYIGQIIPEYNGISRSYCDRVWYGDIDLNVEVYVSKYSIKITVNN